LEGGRKIPKLGSGRQGQFPKEKWGRRGSDTRTLSKGKKEKGAQGKIAVKSLGKTLLAGEKSSSRTSRASCARPVARGGKRTEGRKRQKPGDTPSPKWSSL